MPDQDDRRTRHHRPDRLDRGGLSGLSGRAGRGERSARRRDRARAKARANGRIGLSEAAAIVGVSVQTLRRYFLGTSELPRLPGLHFAVAADDAHQLARGYATRVSVAEAAQRFGTTQTEIRRLLHDGVLSRTPGHGRPVRTEAVIAARYRGDDLVQVGRTVPLSVRQSVDLGAVLEPGTAGHPWPDEIGVGRWANSGKTVALTKVAPTVVAEVSADAALQAGQWRHGLRYQRIRADLRPEDVPQLSGEGPDS